MAKILGYAVAIIGIIIVLLSFSFVRTLFGVSIPGAIGDMYVMIIGALVVIFGFYVAFKKPKISAQEQPKEVPIYQGERVVGYRRAG